MSFRIKVILKIIFGTEYLQESFCESALHSLTRSCRSTASFEEKSRRKENVWKLNLSAWLTASTSVEMPRHSGTGKKAETGHLNGGRGREFESVEHALGSQLELFVQMLAAGGCRCIYGPCETCDDVVWYFSTVEPFYFSLQNIKKSLATHNLHK